jgi:hypothetical protein
MAGKITVSTINDSSGVLATQNGMTGIAKAWLNYNGSTQTVRASYNVSSVTRNSAGLYTINFTTAMPNADYAPVFGGSAAFGISVGGNAWFIGVYTASAGGAPAVKSTTQLQFGTANGGTAQIDVPDAYVAILGS